MLVVPVEKRIDWKRPPIVLILLVVINFLVFAFYQSDDSRHANDAVEAYFESDLYDIEWKAFSAYAREKKLPLKLYKRNQDLIWYMATDDQFGQFVKNNQRYYINKKVSTKWQLERQSVEIHSSKISSNALALSTQKIQILQLLSHQFLHGDGMHLLGNMVFLILTGFAVEAAIGSIRFISFYLLSGIGSGLFFALLADPTSSGLIGASGAISGVMAMYVMLFRTRKIQFFYWFLVFTGYFRAAAIIMLPFYIGYELYNYFSNSDSNVAYTAHIGGFIVGSLLIYTTQSVNSNAIDENYIEGKEEQDPLAQAIQKVYNLMAQCNFEQAWKMLKSLKIAHPKKAALIEIEYHLIRARYPRKKNDYLLHRMGKWGNSKSLIQAQVKLWNQLTDVQKNLISFSKKSQLLLDALELNDLKVAESIFATLNDTQEQQLEIVMLARKLAIYCQSQNRQDKASSYNAKAEKLLTNNNSPHELKASPEALS